MQTSMPISRLRRALTENSRLSCGCHGRVGLAARQYASNDPSRHHGQVDHLSLYNDYEPVFLCVAMLCSQVYLLKL
jgi:hypothetical protein